MKRDYKHVTPTEFHNYYDNIFDRNMSSLTGFIEYTE